MKIRAFVINLERATVRRAAIGQELAAAGIEPEFVPAVDLREVGEDFLRQRFNDFGPWGVVPPHNMAICSSHLRVFERFLQTDADLALVFEDDVYIAPELGLWLEDLSWWPADADIVRFERWKSRTMKHVIAKHATRFAGRRISRIFTRHPGAAGYVISRAHAQRLVAVERISLTTDGFLFNPYVSAPARAARIYQVNPALVTQGNDPADEKTRRKGKPKGARRWRQKLLRSWAEISNAPRHLLRILSGKAELVRLSYAKETRHPKEGEA
ncbi:glycosyltransferase family 25 protein [uncultured Roseobacter sp.]|uniref:glycosyltransferase family 25 protein n=1 Tax=uncultured Roseobacter sp. TaxID=114847 RepID=UPI00261CAA11|nr:glycosyltransferase family 25 protein [uncultured Roseobacter sp.]